MQNQQQNELEGICTFIAASAFVWAAASSARRASISRLACSFASAVRSSEPRLASLTSCARSAAEACTHV